MDGKNKNLREALTGSNLKPLKEAELQADLAANPEDIGLNQLLSQLPDVPVSSNFTSRVLQAVALEEAKISREKRGWPAWRVGFGWVSRLAIAGFSIVIGLVSFIQHQTNARTVLAENVKTVSQAAVIPTEWLENFDTIKRLNQRVPADEELLAALQ